MDRVQMMFVSAVLAFTQCGGKKKGKRPVAAGSPVPPRSIYRILFISHQARRTGAVRRPLCAGWPVRREDRYGR